ncbi:uncharacterized protein TRUGW13939_04850, partial [Talaromyces rugulosus]
PPRDGPDRRGIPLEPNQLLLEQMQRMELLLTNMSARLSHVEGQVNNTTEPPMPEVPTDATPSVTPMYSANKPRHSLDHPDKYDDSDRSRYMQFVAILYAKLTVDAPAIGGPYEQLWYAYGRLAGKAQTKVYPWMRLHGNVNTVTPATLEAFFAHLNVLFEDHQLVEKANLELNRIRQGRTPFQDFISEFERILLLAGGQSWTDDVKISRLKTAINQEMRRATVGSDMPKQYEAFCERLHRVANDLEELKRIDNIQSRYKRNTSRPLTKGTSPDRGQPQVMDWTPAGLPINTVRTDNCFRCGKPGHIAQYCPEPAPLRRAPSPRNRGKKKHDTFTRISNTGVKENETESDTGSDSTSESKDLRLY